MPIDKETPAAPVGTPIGSANDKGKGTPAKETFAPRTLEENTPPIADKPKTEPAKDVTNYQPADDPAAKAPKPGMTKVRATLHHVVNGVPKVAEVTIEVALEVLLAMKFK